MSHVITWVCVGTNPDTVVPTWFYAFRSSEQAGRFLAHAAIEDSTITWDLYPCELLDWRTAMTSFRDNLNSTNQ